MSPPILNIQNLRFTYSQHEILNITDFQIQAEEMVFLYGPSGSGKSTLLELISGILKTQNGQLTVCEKDLGQMSLAQLDQFRAENIGYIFQSFNLIPYLTVIENVILPFLFQKTDYDQFLLEQLTQRLGLKDLTSRNVMKLSVGQQQRVAVARALLKKPKLILADEPTSALDHDHREGFLKMLFDLCRLQKTTVLFVSHDRSIEKLFDRSVNLKTINQTQLKNEKGSI